MSVNYPLNVELLLSHLTNALDGLERLLPDLDDEYDLEGTAAVLARVRRLRGRVVGLDELVSSIVVDQLGPANRVEWAGGVVERDTLSGHVQLEMPGAA